MADQDDDAQILDDLLIEEHVVGVSENPLAASAEEAAEGARAVEADEEPEVSGTVLGLLREWMPVIIIAVLLTVLVRFFIFQPYEIPSGSMLPTLEPGDRVVVNRLSYTAGDLQRGQVVVFDRPPSLPGEDDMIKRIVGLPGETVRFENDAVYVGSLRMVEPYLVDGESTNARTGIPGCAESNVGARTCVVPEGYVFVLGDNRVSSTDSRAFGPIPIETIIGRAALRLWPLTGINQL